MINHVIGLPDLHSENCYSRMTGNHWIGTREVATYAIV